MIKVSLCELRVPGVVNTVRDANNDGVLELGEVDKTQVSGSVDPLEDLKFCVCRLVFTKDPFTSCQIAFAKHERPDCDFLGVLRRKQAFVSPKASSVSLR